MLGGGWAFAASPHDAVQDGKLALNGLQRRSHHPPLTLGRDVRVSAVIPSDLKKADLAVLSLSVSLLSKSKSTMVPLESSRLSDAFKMQFNKV